MEAIHKKDKLQKKGGKVCVSTVTLSIFRFHKPGGLKPPSAVYFRYMYWTWRKFTLSVMQRNNEGQFRSLRTKNDKIWRKISLALIKKRKRKRPVKTFIQNEISPRTAYPE